MPLKLTVKVIESLTGFSGMIRLSYNEEVIYPAIEHGYYSIYTGSLLCGGKRKTPNGLGKINDGK